MQEVKTEIESTLQAQKTTWLKGTKYLALKRGIDIFLVLMLLLLFGIVMLLIALAIKLHSPGPIFYRQIRIGKDGRPFHMLKFRSMRIGNDSDLHRTYVQRLIRENTRPEDLGATSLKLQHDSRITGIGRILRTLGLDELPQLFNVLRGEMSLVGPRPPLPYEYEVYDEWHKQRLQVRPGITGLWQTTAHNLVSFDQMVLIDMQYIAAVSLWLDLKIILRTPWEMFRGIGGG